ncbi:hypothetical protein LJC26_07755 [Desulfovibrio sp. OttesenSCG-928-O18]|nr:hypothetical protein [Desulfovibrio sp. OttesenSCG-928-O18]
MRKSCFFLSVLVCLLVIPGAAFAAEGATRTFDTLAPAELDQLSKVTHAYYMCVADRLDGVTGADRSTPERIFATYPPHIRILRQQCRISLLNVEKQLYAFALNPEFVTNYVLMLREDVEYFALQQVLKKLEAEKEEARAKAARDGENKPQTPAGTGRGIGILTAPSKSSADK